MNNAYAHAWIIAQTSFVIVTTGDHLALDLQWKVGLSTWEGGAALTQRNALTGLYENELFAHLCRQLPLKQEGDNREALKNIILQWDITAEQGVSTKIHPYKDIGFYGIHPFREDALALFVPAPGEFAIVPIMPQSPSHMRFYGISERLAIVAIEDLKQHMCLQNYLHKFVC